MVGAGAAAATYYVDAHVGEALEAFGHVLGGLVVDDLAVFHVGDAGIGVDEHETVVRGAHLGGEVEHPVYAVAAVGADDVRAGFSQFGDGGARGLRPSW